MLGNSGPSSPWLVTRLVATEDETGRLDAFLVGMLGARIYMRWQGDPRVAKLGEPAALVRDFVAALRDRPRTTFACALLILFAW